MIFATFCTITGMIAVCLYEAVTLWHDHPHTWPIKLIVGGLCLLAFALLVALANLSNDGGGPGPGPMSNQDVA